MRITRWIAGALTAGVMVTTAACGGAGGGAGGSDGPIRLGASIPLSGPLAGFGSFQKWGYERAVAEVNAAGGIEIDGTKRKVELTLLDDKTDPNTTSSNTSRLITRDNVDAMLGSCTPALVNAGALIAERNRVPMVTGCDPLGAFRAVKDWQYVWDIFFDEADLSAATFKTIEARGLETNKKLAILADNGPDGKVVGGKLVPAAAKEFGWDVVMNESFPTEATQFSSLVQQAKASGADMVFVDAVTPQAVAIRKQLAAADFTPKVLVMEKGAEPVQFAETLGDLADGVLVGGYWDPTFDYPGAADLAERFESETGNTSSQHIADSNAAAAVLLDAIAKAGSTDPEKVNDAIAATDDTYVVGPVKFGDDNTSKLPVVTLQWQDGATKIVGPDPETATGKLIEP